MLKMYIVVRGNIPVGAQGVQGMHALANFAVEHPKEFKAWQADSNTLVFLSVPDEVALERLAENARDGGFKHTVFVEPAPLPTGLRWRRTESDTKTAIAIEPHWLVQNVLVAGLPLAPAWQTEDPDPRTKQPRRRWFE